MGKAAQNSTKTVRRVVGRPFPKGISGNPSGRPKTIRPIIEEEAESRDPREIVRFHFSVMRGRIRGVRRGGVPIKERRLSAEWLGNQFFGKAAQSIELSGKGGGPVQTFDVGKLSDEQLEQLTTLAAAASEPGGAGEGGEGGEGAPASR